MALPIARDWNVVLYHACEGATSHLASGNDALSETHCGFYMTRWAQTGATAQRAQLPGHDVSSVLSWFQALVPQNIP